MRSITTIVGGLAGASATNIRTASSGTAGALVFTGSPATVPGFYVVPGSGARIAVPAGQALLDKPREILITTASNETATITLSGLDWAGNPISEIVQLATAGTFPSVLTYAVLLSATLSANSVGNISIGTNTVASSPWVRLDDYGWSNVSLQCTVAGTVNYTVQATLDDPDDTTNPVAAASMTWVNSADANVVGATGTQQSNYFFLPKYIRCLLNSGTGTVTMTVIQAAGVL